MNLCVKRLGRYWWILGDEDAGPMGPYVTEAEAEEDCKGLIRSDRYGDEPGFVTVDDPRLRRNR